MNPTRVVSRWLRCATAASAMVWLAQSGAAQDLDIWPAYHPEGPDGHVLEAYAQEPLTLELSLPGLDHAASLAVASQWLSWIALAPSVLSTPIPLSDVGLLWLDPANLFLQLAPQSLSSPLVLQLEPGLSGVDLPMQVLSIQLSDPLFKFWCSPLIHLKVLLPQPKLDDAMIPLGSKAPGTSSVTFDAVNNRYNLQWQSGSELLNYQLNLSEPAFSKGTIKVLETTSGVSVVRDGGFSWAQGNGVQLWNPATFQSKGTHTLLTHGIVGKQVFFEWKDEMPKVDGTLITRKRRQEFTLVGRSLKIEARSLEPKGPAADNYFAFGLQSFGPSPGFPITSMKDVNIKYMDQIGITLLSNDWFLSGFCDLFKSSATIHNAAVFTPLGQNGRNTESMVYTSLSDGTLYPVHETAWVTLSRNVRDCFVETTAPASPRAVELSERIGVTLSEEEFDPLNYQRDRQFVEQLQAWGFEDVFLFKFHWMNAGTNRRATTHTPPNPAYGTEAEFKELVAAAGSDNWKVALYTDFYSLDQAEGFDNNPNYSETPGKYENFENGVRRADLSYREGFTLGVDPSNPNTSSYFTRILAPRRILDHWDREAKVIVDEYGANAAYFDITTISAPDLIITAGGVNVGGPMSGDVRSPNDQNLEQAIQSYKHAFFESGSRAGGPVVGEGSFFSFETRFDSFYAGYLDGVYRTLSTGGDPADPAFAGAIQPVMPDYEWTCVRPKQYGFGMGQYTRFLDPEGPGGTPLPDAALEEIRATSISYGHNGFFLSNSALSTGFDFLSQAQQVKEYYLFRSLQREWHKTKSSTVLYRTLSPGSPYLSLSDALRQGLDLATAVIKITFDTGLSMVINHSPVDVYELPYTLPSQGWVIRNPNTGYTNLSILDPLTLVPMHRVLAPEYELADGNGNLIQVGGAIGTTTDLSLVRYDTGLVLREGLNGSILIQ